MSLVNYRREFDAERLESAEKLRLADMKIRQMEARGIKLCILYNCFGYLTYIIHKYFLFFGV